MNSRRILSRRILLVLPLLLVLGIVGAVLWWFYKNTQPVTAPAPSQQTTQEEQRPAKLIDAADKPAEFDAVALQKVVDKWGESLSSGSTAGIVLTDKAGTVLAKLNPKQSFFTASIYKMYVAYEGYRQVDSGEVDPDEVFLNGQTRAQCLDLMIRESDSPCAEKLWVELGKENLTKKMKSYGLKNTSLVSLATTSEDAAAMTARIARGEGLSKASQNAFLNSMKKQIYRDTLNKAFSAGVTVYNKIGFNLLLEYHDVALVKFEAGRQLVVSVLTRSVGTRKIIELGTAIEAAVR